MIPPDKTIEAVVGAWRAKAAKAAEEAAAEHGYGSERDQHWAESDAATYAACADQLETLLGTDALLAEAALAHLRGSRAAAFSIPVEGYTLTMGTPQDTARLVPAHPAPALTAGDGAVRLALDYSRNFATAKPDIGGTEREHILGLCKLVEQIASARALSPMEVASMARLEAGVYDDLDADSACVCALVRRLAPGVTG